MFFLDTNIYIAAFNEPDFGAEFSVFHRDHLPRLLLSAVVAHELMIGARTPDRRRKLQRGLLEPFRTRGRIHVPTLATWEVAADLNRRLREAGGCEGSLTQRSFGNDLLLAASARELGALIITRNLADFERIGRVVALKFAAPWPELQVPG